MLYIKVIIIMIIIKNFVYGQLPVRESVCSYNTFKSLIISLNSVLQEVQNNNCLNILIVVRKLRSVFGEVFRFLEITVVTTHMVHKDNS